MEEMVNTGVNESVVAEQTETTQDTAQETAQTTTQENTGVKQQAAAVPNEGVEKAFAARLKEATEKARQEALKSHPHLSYLEQKAQRLGMTVEQLIENDRKYEEQLEIQQRAQKDQVSYEYAERLYKLEQKEQQREQEAESIRQKQEQQKMYAEFLEAYPDAKPEEIPPEVWAATKRGEPLLSAYARYENKRLKAEMEKFQQQQQTQQADTKNAQTSTGSARSSGQAGVFFTREQVEAMTTAEVAKNLTAIRESRKHWK